MLSNLLCEEHFYLYMINLYFSVNNSNFSETDLAPIVYIGIISYMQYAY